MAKLFEEIDDKLQAFIEAQPMFFVATAPSGDDGHVNLSPKGGIEPLPRHRPAWIRLRGPDGQRDRDGRPPARERPHRGHVLRVLGAAQDHPAARPRSSGAAGRRGLRGGARRVRHHRRAAPRRALGDLGRGHARGRLVRLRRAADGLRGRARPALPLRRQPAAQGGPGRRPRLRLREQRGEHRRAHRPRFAGRRRRAGHRRPQSSSPRGRRRPSCARRRRRPTAWRRGGPARPWRPGTRPGVEPPRPFQVDGSIW